MLVVCMYCNCMGEMKFNTVSTNEIRLLKLKLDIFTDSDSKWIMNGN